MTETIIESETVPASGRTPALDNLMRSMGYIILHWSLLERAFLDDIRRLRMVDGDSGEAFIRARGSFSERLAEWRALTSLKARRNPEAAQEIGDLSSLAERLRRQRNMIGSHFTGAVDDKDGPAILVSDGGVSSLRSAQQTITLAGLDHLIFEMSDCQRRIERLARALADVD